MKAKKAPLKQIEAMRALASLGPVINGSLCTANREGKIRWQLTDRPAGKTRALYVPLARVQEVRLWIRNWKGAKWYLRMLAEATRVELGAKAVGYAVAARPRRRTTASSQTKKRDMTRKN